MTDNVISLEERRKKKTEKNPVIETIKESLDNAAVMRRYGISQPTLAQRAENIKQSIARINALMNDLKQTTEVKTK